MSFANRRQPIIWTNGGIFHSHIYASLGLNELKYAYWKVTKNKTNAALEEKDKDVPTIGTMVII